MNEQQILLSVAGIGGAALACQWLAWRLKLPAILFLLLAVAAYLFTRRLTYPFTTCLFKNSKAFHFYAIRCKSPTGSAYRLSV